MCMGSHQIGSRVLPAPQPPPYLHLCGAAECQTGKQHRATRSSFSVLQVEHPARLRCDLRVQVANKGIVFGADGVATVPEDADEEEEPEEEDPVETPGAVAPAVATDPEEAPEDYPQEEPEGDPPVEPPVDAEPEDPEEEIPIEDYSVPPEEEETVDPGDELTAEPPAETDEEMAAEPPVTPPEETPVDEAGAEAGAEPDFDAAMAPEAARRRRSLLEALPVPLGECPTGAVASWQQTYNKKTVNPHSQFKIYQAAESLVKAVESGGGLPTATLMGAPEFGVIKTLEVGEEFDPVRVCSWKYVLCGAEEILQVGIVGGAGTIPPEITNVQGLKGIAVAGDGDAEGGEPAPALDLQGNAQVLTCFYDLLALLLLRNAEWFNATSPVIRFSL